MKNAVLNKWKGEKNFKDFFMFNQWKKGSTSDFLITSQTDTQLTKLLGPANLEPQILNSLVFIL